MLGSKKVWDGRKFIVPREGHWTPYSSPTLDLWHAQAKRSAMDIARVTWKNFWWHWRENYRDWRHHRNTKRAMDKFIKTARKNHAKSSNH